VLKPDYTEEDDDGLPVTQVGNVLKKKAMRKKMRRTKKTGLLIMMRKDGHIPGWK
jgi:hypothetical protein